jgi:hypothetical protein
LSAANPILQRLNAQPDGSKDQPSWRSLVAPQKDGKTLDIAGDYIAAFWWSRVSDASQPATTAASDAASAGEAALLGLNALSHCETQWESGFVWRTGRLSI